ncbi:MAG: substrate-binding domain-containing protein, partial [Actinocatenispora sp.]
YGLADDLVARCENDSADGRRAATALLDLSAAPTALVCVSDVIALGCLSELAVRGLRPGRDVAVAGFDDAPFAALPGIDLTSVQQPIEHAGADVVRLLVNALAGNTTEKKHILLAPSLRVRSSTILSGDPNSPRGTHTS